MAFIDLEKAFDRVPLKVIWWALRKLGVEEWIVRLVQGMYGNARSHIRVGEGYSEEFEVKVGVQEAQYSARCSSSLCLKPCHASSALGSPGRISYADDLVIIAESLKECVRRLLTWKEALEEKGLRVKCWKAEDHYLQ